MQINEKLPLIFGVPGKDFYKCLKDNKAFVAELRPELSGATIVAEQLLKRKMQPVIICDNMIAFCMERGLVSCAYIFRLTENKKSGSCRTGSLIVALCAEKYGIPVYLCNGDTSKIKQTSLLRIGGVRLTSADINTYVPLFEDVPLELVKEVS